jgi:tetratricopeptide (TPR) repeat protein
MSLSHRRSRQTGQGAQPRIAPPLASTLAPPFRPFVRWSAGAVLLATLLGTPAWAQVKVTSPKVTISNSPMDAETFYQLLVSETALRGGEPQVAYQVMLEAARRNRSDTLYRRAVDMAIGGRAPDQAVAALKQWRQTLPKSRPAAETQAQVLMALGRPQEAQEPLRSAIELTPTAERSQLIGTLAGLILRGDLAGASAQALDDVLKPWKEQAATRSAALQTAARGWLVAGNTGRALTLAAEAQRADPQAEVAALIGIELFGKDPRAEALIQTYLATAEPSAAVRLLYARRLTSAQRYREALVVSQQILTSDTAFAPAWLMQGALQIELGEAEAARTSLTRFLALNDQTPARSGGDDAVDDEDAAEAHAASNNQDRSQALLMLAQASEQLKDFVGAQRWLEQMGDAQESSGVLVRRASLLSRQGKLDEARQLLRTLPERTADDRRAKVMAETQLLREARDWPAAHQVLVDANRALPDDPDLLYEQALLAEKLQRFDEMENLLRHVIAIKPDQQHAYNALGYSLADRGQRLDEAHALVSKALALSPGDPFITDSLGWVEYRMGRGEGALTLLQAAYGQRSDVEIGAHLGEVLWALGRQDEALRVWRAGQARDAGNEVLAETLARLKVSL